MNDYQSPALEGEGDDIETGIYHDISHDEYLEMPGLSVSKLKVFSQAPAKARWGEQKETAAMRLGTVWHCAVLEAEKFEKRYTPTRLDRRGTKAWEAETQAAMGRELLKQDEYDEALYVRDAVFQHPVARALLTGLNAVEQSFFWRDERTGLLKRGRADLLRTDMRVIGDVKTTADASEKSFSYTVDDFKYHWQQAHYEEGISAAAGWVADGFIFLAIEKTKPFLVGAYELAQRAVEKGREDIRTQTDRYAECVRNDNWPGYSDRLETIDLPYRAYKES